MKKKKENCLENDCTIVEKYNLQDMKIVPFENNYANSSDMITLFSAFSP